MMYLEELLCLSQLAHPDKISDWGPAEMKKTWRRLFRKTSFPVLFIILFASLSCVRQGLDQWSYTPAFDPDKNIVTVSGQFNGYLNYWENSYYRWSRYGNLFQVSLPDVARQVAQSKLDIAEDLGIPGLWMQEGFLYGLLAGSYRVLEQPSVQELEGSPAENSLLVFVDSESPVGEMLESKLPPGCEWKEILKSTQFQSTEFKSVKAFYLESGVKKLFVVSSGCSERLGIMKDLIGNVKDLLEKYDLHRGWTGVKTTFKSVTCSPGHPLEIIGQAMSQGNDWLLFSGYMDFFFKKDLANWLEKVNLPFVADVGLEKATHSLGTIMYGCRNYDGIKPQDTPAEEEWLEFARERGGYVFRPVYQDSLDAYQYDGYIGTLGNKKQIDSENIPFIIDCGSVRENIPPCMVLFVDKGLPLTNERMYGAVLARRNVAIMERVQMMGPEIYRKALQFLYLDRIYLEEYFADRVQIEAEVQGKDLIINLENTYPRAVAGVVKLSLPPELSSPDGLSKEILLAPGEARSIVFPIRPSLAAMGQDNPIAVHFKWEDKNKGTLAVMKLPPVISMHRLLYGHAPEVLFPVTIHNYTDQPRFPVLVQVFQQGKKQAPVFETEITCATKPDTFSTLLFELKLPAGHHNVKVSCLGTENFCQLGVGSSKGSPSLYEIDLNNDGIKEYRMENDKVRVTLLRTGARVIEYIVKERNDNLFFKLWPAKPNDDRLPYRERDFYPYGGFEDFLGQASMETHKLYDAQVLRKEGDYVRVKMTADYYGNKLEKIYTLYGDTPLLEARFALTFKNTEANMIGPQPILELGDKHWTEDAFFVPAMDGIKEFRMRPYEFYGRVLDLKEGWNAGYETKENTTFIGAFPVTEPEFLHMWMNHPVNSDSHYYYAEFQPWVHIFQQSTRYFSYYMWGDPGSWENGVMEIEKMGLLTTR